MEIIRLTTWVKASAGQCFKLATSAEFHAALAKPSKDVMLTSSTPNHELSVGDQLLWPGRYLGLQLQYSSRIDLLRPPDYFREVLVEGPFRHFEHDHHFTPLNEGTRMRDEVRFQLPSGLLGPMSIPVVRRYLISRIALRNELLKEAAEAGIGGEFSERQPPRSESVSRAEGRSDAPQRVATGQIVAH